MPEHTNSLELLERSRAFQEQLMDIDSLDGLISLACTLLDCSLYICDSQGFILGNSPIDARTCHAFRHTVEKTRQVSKDKLKTMLGPTPLCNVLRDPLCEGDTCARLSFPLQIGETGLPGAITYFFWHGAPSQDDQALASMVSGTFSAYMRRRFFTAGALQASKISLLRELLDYKPGLKSYYERGIAMENLHTLSGHFRIVCMRAEDTHSEDAATLAMEIQYRLPSAYVFPFKNSPLIVFNESQADADEVIDVLEHFLNAHALTACMSMEFSNLLELRYVYEDTQVCLTLAARKAPDRRMHRAERYIDLAFLSKCREYFPIEQYYPEGFKRLHDYDEETGKEYLRTLTAYLDNNMSVSAAAKEIFVHRNTMTQQLEKIEELLGVSLKEKEMCWYLQLCLRIHELFHL